jgi:2-polyprenyl-3-methyl-5-hydroxy-6-metoxy-1,4-benzoquinol methylase
MDKLFVDHNINIKYGKDAEESIKNQNDFVYYNKEEKGVHKIDSKRWETAQKYEKLTWMRNNLSAKDDRNNEHLSRFENLISLSEYNSKIENVIELGCGPFTNLRLFKNFSNINNITLVDPLINEYLNHPNCTYKNQILNGKKVELIPSSIETLSIDKKYDLVIIINVIEHCFDVDKIFEKIYSLLKDGGILIFSDVYFKDVPELLNNIYDAGHPLRLSEQKINTFIQKFTEVYSKRFHNLYNQDWRNDLYFIGKK